MLSFTLCFSSSQYSVSVVTLLGSSKSLNVDLVAVQGLINTLMVSSYRRTYMPSSYHIAQELQKYNIPDYRPRQEQCVKRALSLFSVAAAYRCSYRFQKAIKKVRAVQRMRRNRGFAFSQTENGKQDQAKLIRAYDTSKSGAKPSGY